MRVNIRQVVGAATGAPGAPQLPGITPLVPPVAPAPEPVKFGVKEVVESIRDIREGMGSSRELVREGRGLWKDLQEMFPNLGKREEVPGSLKEKTVDPARRSSGPDWNAAMRDPEGGGRPPARVEVVQDRAPPPAAVPPKSEAELALREETRVLLGRVKGEDLEDLLILAAGTLAEGYDLPKTADFVFDHEAKLRDVMRELGDVRLKGAALVVLEQVDEATLPVVKHFLQKAAGAEPEKTEAPAGPEPPTPPSAAPAAKRAPKKAAKRGAPKKAAKKKGGRRS